MSKESILKKVRALLAKTVKSGAAPAEAESSLALANRLMRKHQIDQKDLQLSLDNFGTTTILAYKKSGEGGQWEITIKRPDRSIQAKRFEDAIAESINSSNAKKKI